MSGSDGALGRMPNSWRVCCVGEVLSRIEAGKSPDCPDTPAYGDSWGVLKVGAVHSSGFRCWENKVVVRPEHIISEYQVHPGDVLFSRANTYELVGECCLVGETPPRLMLSDKTLRLVPDHRSIVSGYLVSILQSQLLRARIQTAATGTSGSMKNIGQQAIRRLPLTLPPLPEQRRIAEILDTADEAIRRSEALLAKLEQVKAGLLHDLLTRGLDEAGRLRDPEAHPEQFQDSVMGRIPREWEVSPVSGVSEAYAGGTPPRGLPGAFGSSIPWVKSAECNLTAITNTEESLSYRGLAVSSARWIEAGTPLIALYGATAGAVSWLTIRATSNQAVLAVPSTAGRTAPRWLYWCLLFRAGAMLNTVQGSGQPNLNKDIVTGTLIPLPPLPEQRRIAATLDAHDARLRAERTQLDKLRQIKKGLMHDLLTGKVRVPIPPEATA